MAFDGGTSQPLGILPKFLVTLGGKTVYTDVMVVQGDLDFSLLLGHDHIFAIDQLSFFSLLVPPVQQSSPIGSCSQAVPSLPQVNYVATCSISASTDDYVDDLVHHVLETSEPDLSLVSNDMCFYRSMFLPTREDLLGAMFSYGP